MLLLPEVDTTAARQTGNEDQIWNRLTNAAVMLSAASAAAGLSPTPTLTSVKGHTLHRVVQLQLYSLSILGSKHLLALCPVYESPSLTCLF